MSKTKQKSEIADSVGVTHTLKVTVPDTWEVVPLETVLEDIVGGGTPSRDNPSYWNGSIPWLTVKDMRTRRPEDSIDHISDQAVRDSATNIIPADTVIIATRIGLGKVIRVPYDAAINQDLKALITKPAVDKSYLEYWIYSIANYLESIGSGTTVKGIRLEHVRSLPFPLAPLDQQKQIVAEIEKQFSRLDEAVANLKRVKANLKRYKAAVLKAAVEGRLVETEAELARKRTPSPLAGEGTTQPPLPLGEGRGEGAAYETGEQLLQRILETRRSQWKGKGKYKEPAAPDTTDLPELPEGWAWATLPQLGELNRGKSKHRPRDDKKLYGGPYPFIQTGDVRKSEGTITEYSQTYSEFGLKQSRLWPAGTLCITIAANIAETGILKFAACFPDSVVGFLIEDGATTTRYVEYFIRTAREELERFAPATAQKNINLEVLEAVAVPLPPLAEQERIVAEVDRRLSLIWEVEGQINDNCQRAERLRQAILKNAFTGHLSSIGQVPGETEKTMEELAT